jgi:signal transduction histidine kinase
MPQKLYVLLVNGVHDFDAGPLLAEFQRAGQVVEWHRVDGLTQLAELLERRRATPAPPSASFAGADAAPGTGDRSRTIYDHLPNPTFIWRRAGEAFILADVNEAAHVASRHTMRGHLGKTAAEIVPEFPLLEADLLACLQQRRAVKREVRFRHPPDGPVRHVIATYGFLPPDMVLQHTEDVTDQRRTEVQLQRGQRLEAIGQLAGGVAHDFNNLLTVISGYAESGIDRLSDGDPLRADLEEIRRAAEHAAGLTRQLLAFSRRQVLKPSRLNLNTVIVRIEKMLRRLIGEDIDLQATLAGDLGSISADAGQIEQVVINLSVNARDAMPNGGRLALETTNLEVDDEFAALHPCLRPGPYVQVSVTDTGIGMDADTKARLFEPFFTTKEPGHGTGLGLATVYGIVKQSGGHIRVQSEPAQGASFILCFPRVEGQAVEGHRRAGAIAPSASHEVVLVVEDDEAVRRFTTRVLEMAGYRVLVAADGEEALHLSREAGERVRLLITDLIMPRMNGRHLADRLAERWPGLQVIYVSGYADATIVRHGMLEPGTDFVAKPFTAVELTTKVRQVLGRLGQP